MEFYISKNATLPLLKMQIVKDGRSDYKNFNDLIEKSSIYFSMIDTKTGRVKINLSAAGFVNKIFDDPNTPPEYYIYYQFTKKDTKKIGRYEGQFLLKNDEGTLILPIREILHINIIESTIPDDENIIQINGTSSLNLGRLHFPDVRDSSYLIVDKIPQISRPQILTSKYWDADVWWGNQGNTPMCVGYAWAHWVEDGPIIHNGPHPIISPITIYKEAQKIDEWPGENYDGTSVRAGAKYLKNTNKISSYLWAYDLNTLINTVLSVGPVVVGTNWYYGMFFPDRNGLIRVSGYLAGGHAYVINGVDVRSQLFRIKNSWGRSWGKSGHAFISFNNMIRLIRERGEICLAIENKF